MSHILLTILLLASQVRTTGNAPAMPYVDKGACPFECCTYGKWTARHETTVVADHRPGSPAAFRLKAGEPVTADYGFVVTTRPGRIRATSPVTIGEGKDRTSLQPGDVVYVLHYVGEGNDLLWFKGRELSEELHTDRPGPIEHWKGLELLETPTTEWWVRMKNSAGQVGWTQHADDFEGADACG